MLILLLQKEVLGAPWRKFVPPEYIDHTMRILAQRSNKVKRNFIENSKIKNKILKNKNLYKFKN